MISPEQSRAARAWLEWSQANLAEKANVGLSTIRDFEKGRHVPQRANLEAIQSALEVKGVRLTFTDGGNPSGIEVLTAK